MMNPLEIRQAMTRSRHNSIRLFIVVALVATAGISATAVYLRSGIAESLGKRMTRFEWILGSLKSYDRANGRLPDSIKRDSQGNVLYSWRATVVPYTEAVGDLFDAHASWEAPTNRLISKQLIPLYCAHDENDSIERLKGVVSAIVGLGTPLQPERSLRLSDVPRDTILLIEVKPSAAHWMAPGDTTLDADRLHVRKDSEGVLVGFADGEIWYLRDSVPVKELMKFATASPSEARDRNASLGPHRVLSRRTTIFDRPIGTNNRAASIQSNEEE
jgi:hypothetical protein